MSVPFFLRPALRQDLALKRVLREFEGPALLALAGVLIGTSPGPARAEAPPLSSPDLVARLQGVKDQPDDAVRDVDVAKAVIDVALGATNVRQTDRFRYNYACYLAQHTSETGQALEMLAEVLAGNPDWVAWARNDPSFDVFIHEDRQRFLALLGQL